MPKKSNTNPERIFRCLLLRVFRWKDIEQQKTIEGVGKPDFVMGRYILDVFGCYWHGCSRCYPTPLNEKMRLKREKDAARSERARALGYEVHLFWECDLYERPAEVLARLKRLGGE